MYANYSINFETQTHNHSHLTLEIFLRIVQSKK